MKTNAGLWIDHRAAIIVALMDIGGEPDQDSADEAREQIVADVRHPFHRDPARR